MRLRVICVGKPKKTFGEISRTFETRVRRYARLEIVELPEAKYRGTPSDGERQRLLQKERETIERELAAGRFIVILDAAGKMLSSEEFAHTLNEKAVWGIGDVDFVIGGSLGIADELKRQGDLLLSLSPMTYPHQLARIVLLEQLYRAFAILRGEPYHK